MLYPFYKSFKCTGMSTHGQHHKSNEAHEVEERYPEGLGMGANLTHVKTSGGMTISPELFEKVILHAAFSDLSQDMRRPH